MDRITIDDISVQKIMLVMRKVEVDFADDGADVNYGTESFTICIEVFVKLKPTMICHSLSIFVSKSVNIHCTIGMDIMINPQGKMPDSFG